MFMELLCIKAASHVRGGSRSRRQGYEGGPPCHCGVDHRAKDPQLLETLEPEHEQLARLVSARMPGKLASSPLQTRPASCCPSPVTMIAIAAATLP